MAAAARSGVDQGAGAGRRCGDEYDTEAELLFDFVEELPQKELVVGELMPILEASWRKNFSLDDAGIEARREALRGLAEQVERFFGPEAKPQVRGV